MATPESLDQLQDQRDYLVQLAARRCEDFLTINPALIAGSSRIDGGKILTSHIEVLKAEFYPMPLRDELIERGKEIYVTGHVDGKWGQVAQKRQDTLRQLSRDERVDQARVQALMALRSEIRVELRAAFDSYLGYEATIQELSRDINELARELGENEQMAVEPEDETPSVPRLTPRALLMSAGSLARRYMK